MRPKTGPALMNVSSERALDVDTTDETVLIDALDRHCHTPVVIRSGSGKFHA